MRRDSLTGLFDVHTLECALTEAIRATKRDGGQISLLFIDLDSFNQVNERHGHLAGSRILSQVARFIDASTRPTTGFAARFGGDEFVLVLPGHRLERALEHAERLRADLAATILPGGLGPKRRPLVHLTCSIGVASLRATPRDEDADRAGPERPVEDSAMRLLQSADEAMYRAKSAGRNRVVAARDEASGAA